MIASASYPYGNTTVLVTGAGSGIGASIAKAFLEQGASVGLVGRTEATLKSVANAFPPDRTEIISADIADSDSISDAVQRIHARFGHLDVVVNSAGVFEGGPIEDFDDKKWERLRSTNLDGTFYLARAAAPYLKQSQGTIIAISSVSGLRGDWGQFAYNATKGATNAMMQSLALDLGPFGVRVNAVAPSFTATRLTQDRLDDPAFAAALHNRLALPRAASPDDIARAVLFLASPDAAYITGVVLPVDGGITASTGQPHFAA
jgi:meso-butanediol dehydrogenase / (S,S)-butanediol dehydrogenase / diacetyl reductase